MTQSTAQILKRRGEDSVDGVSREDVASFAARLGGGQQAMTEKDLPVLAELLLRRFSR